MKRRLILECDDVELFDAIKKVGDGGEACAMRIISMLLAGENWREAAGLSMYGIEVIPEGSER